MNTSPNWWDALTLHRPWPWAILHAGKNLENRDWPPPKWLLGKHLAIHAGKAWDEEGAEWIRETFAIDVPPEPQHPLGVVGVGVVLTWVETGERTDGTVNPWFVGRYGWHLGSVRELARPVPLSGRQKLWRISGDALETIRAGWKAGRIVEDM